MLISNPGAFCASVTLLLLGPWQQSFRRSLRFSFCDRTDEWFVIPVKSKHGHVSPLFQRYEGWTVGQRFADKKGVKLYFTTHMHIEGCLNTKCMQNLYKVHHTNHMQRSHVLVDVRKMMNKAAPSSASWFILVTVSFCLLTSPQYSSQIWLMCLPTSHGIGSQMMVYSRVSKHYENSPVIGINREVHSCMLHLIPVTHWPGHVQITLNLV